METRITATAAVRGFSDLMNRIRYRGEEFVVERGGEPICRMTSATPSMKLTLRDLASLLRQVARPDAEYASDVRDAASRQGRVPRSRWGR